MFFSNKKNIFKNHINNSIFTKERKVKSEDNLLFIKIPNRLHKMFTLLLVITSNLNSAS